MDVKVGVVNLEKPLGFTFGWWFYYGGERSVKIITQGIAMGLTRLGRLYHDNKVVIIPDDFDKIKIQFLDLSNSIRISIEERTLFKKRFNLEPEDVVKGMLPTVIENLTVNTDYSKTESGKMIMYLHEDPLLADRSSFGNKQFEFNVFVPTINGTPYEVDMNESKLIQFDSSKLGELITWLPSKLSPEIISSQKEIPDQQELDFD